jgi:hypothetical protein
MNQLNRENKKFRGARNDKEIANQELAEYFFVEKNIKNQRIAA